MSTFTRYPVVVLERIAVEDYLNRDHRSSENAGEQVGLKCPKIEIKQEFVSETPAERSAKDKIDIPHDVKCEVGASPLSECNDSYRSEKPRISDLVGKIKKEKEEPGDITYELVDHFLNHSSNENGKSLLLGRYENLKNESNARDKSEFYFDSNAPSVSIDNSKYSGNKSPFNHILGASSNSSQIHRNAYSDSSRTGVTSGSVRFEDLSLAKQLQCNQSTTKVEKVSALKELSSQQIDDKAYKSKNHHAKFRLKCLNYHVKVRSRKKSLESKPFTKKSTQVGMLDVHLKAVNSTRPIKCAQCLAAFKTKSALVRHISVHSNEKPFICDQCQTTFKMKGALRVHLKVRHSSERPFKCDQCQRTFKAKGDLQTHLNVHVSEKLFKCDECQAAFKTKDSIKSHMKVHSNEKPFRCDQCPAAFKGKCGLRAHLLVHSDKKPFKCDQCGAAFKTKSSLQSHLMVHSDVKPFKCNQCQAAFKIKTNLTLHMTVHRDKRPFKCDQCGAAFKSKVCLKSHLKSHSDEKPFKCDRCPAACKIKGSLKSHMMVHSNERSFKCDQCQAAFKGKSGLRQHRRQIHSDERPFKCDQCQSTFKVNSVLRAHLKAHNKKSFECSECGAELTSAGRLNYHMRSVHSNEKPFKCQRCSAEFRQSFSLGIHMRMHDNH